MGLVKEVRGVMLVVGWEVAVEKAFLGNLVGVVEFGKLRQHTGMTGKGSGMAVGNWLGNSMVSLVHILLDPILQHEFLPLFSL